ENNLEDSLEKFRNLLIFVKEKFCEDLKILSNNIAKGKERKGKSLNQNSYLQTSNSNILDVIADEITCPINSEPTDQLYIDIRYLPQNSIYKNLYTKFFESGHVLPSIELENSDQLYDTYIYRCLNNYEQAHLYLKEAINLNYKKPVAYFICGEIYFRQNQYGEAIDYIKISLEYKAKLTNLYTILGNSHLLRNCYTAAAENYNISLKKDSNNYLCLKNCAYSYERQEDYLNALKLLDKLLSINMKDSLVLCYYGEILYNMKQYNKSILYFTKANIIDPENIHNLNKRAIAYYIIKEYDKVLLDFDKIIQLDPLNSSAYYLKSLTYYTKNDINNAKISFKKCKIHIELNKYYEAKVDLDMLFKPPNNYKAFSYIHLLQEHSEFWSFLYRICKVYEYDFAELRIVNEFSKYMYYEKEVYFISNLTNLNSELCKFQESDISSLSGLVLCSKNEELHLDLPSILYQNYGNNYLICKMNVKKIL
ncbi:TPR-like protein, partial [Rhizophagus irregularis]